MTDAFLDLAFLQKRKAAPKFLSKHSTFWVVDIRIWKVSHTWKFTKFTKIIPLETEHLISVIELEKVIKKLLSIKELRAIILNF